MIFFVVGPGLPSPIVRPSSSTTGPISAAVPLMNASSADQTSYRVKSRSSAFKPSCGTISRTVSRVTPGRFVEVHGVTIVELRMMKKFSAVASDTYPWMSSIKASSAPYWFASTRAMMLFR